MADVAITLVVQTIVPTLYEALREVGGVETDVKNIKDELERMNAFLKDADSAMENSDMMINLVNQVRDVALDTEDVVDKFVLSLAKNHQDCVRGCSNTVLYKYLNWVMNLRFNSSIVSKIKSINARVMKIAEGQQIYQISSGDPNSNSNVDTSFDLADDTRGDALLEEEANLVGIERPKSELMRMVMESGSGLTVISVAGIVGVGKSALVKQVYDDAQVKKRFQSHAWITFPRAISNSDTLKTEELLKDLIGQLFRETKEETNTKNKNQLKEGIHRFLQEKRYVIVLDDVRNTLEWDAIKCVFPGSSSGSRIIITTRDNAVASHSSMGIKENVYWLEPLTREQSLTLFCQKTFRGGSCPSHLKDITINVLERCAGLPLAIKSVAGLLASKSNRLSEWETVNNNLGAELEINNRSLNMILLLSFNDLPYHLKYCLLYMVIYPEYHLIKSNSLIRLWITEGFVKERQGLTVEQVAQGYLKVLADKNLIQVVKPSENGNIKAFRMHYFLRENLLEKSKRQSFLMTVGNNSNDQWNDKARRLSIHGPWENFNPQMSGEKLRSLLAFGVTDLKSLSSILELLNNSRLLKVLDLSGLPLESFPKVITKLLLLRYLSLRRTKIKSLPRSIKKLQKLEMLDLKYSHVTKLPVEILQLQNLRHLIISSYGGDVARSSVAIDKLVGFKPPIGIGALTSLYILYFVEASADIIEDLGNMKELRRLFIFKLRREDGMIFCSSIQKLQNLQSLDMFSSAENEILDLDHRFSPPASLQELSLSGRLEKFPYWIKSLNNLVRVCFRWSRLSDDPVQYLQDLPSLVRLQLIDQGYVGEELHFKAGKFLSLKKLYLDKLKPLKQVIIEVGAMPNLKRIKIQQCNYLESVPAGIECLTKMKVLKCFNMSSEFVKKMLGEDSHKIAHIPTLQFCEDDDPSEVRNSSIRDLA